MPLDLRWGVTSEQSGTGQVLKICLEEIDRCRPFFIGSLGKLFCRDVFHSVVADVAMQLVPRLSKWLGTIHVLQG